MASMRQWEVSGTQASARSETIAILIVRTANSCLKPGRCSTKLSRSPGQEAYRMFDYLLDEETGMHRQRIGYERLEQGDRGAGMASDPAVRLATK
jgi:hypothetical protein